MTTLSIKKGASVDALKAHDPVEFGDDVKTTAQLRTILVEKKVMAESDQFVGKDGSLLKRDVEGSTQWSDLLAEEAVRIISSETANGTAPANGDAAVTVENGEATAGETAAPPVDTVPTKEDSVPTKGDSVPAAVDAVPATADTAPADTAPATKTVRTTVEVEQKGNESSADYTATENGGETKTESQGYVKRTKTEVIETALNKTGVVVQQKFTQGMQEARVAVEKVVAIAGAQGAKVAESVATQKARLQGAGVARAGSAIMDFGGIVTGTGDSLKSTPSIQMSPKLTNMFKDTSQDAPKDASEAPGEAHPLKGRSASATVVPTVPTLAPPQPRRAATEPAPSSEDVPEKAQLDGLPSHVEEDPREDGQKTTSSPLHLLPNLADFQFDSARYEVPMAENLKNFTQDHWDELCHNNNILKGVRLEDSGPNPSIANLIEPLTMDDIHYALNDVARTEHTTTYTERNSNYADHGWTTKALLLTIPWVDGSVNAEKDELRERSKEVKTVYTSVFQRYPFVTVRIKPQALRPTEEFKNAINNALVQPVHKRRAALDKIFNIYGHAFQMEFDLGALMVKTSSTNTSTDMSQEKFEEKLGFEFKAIISKIPIPPYVKAGAVADKGKTVNDSKVEHDADKQQVYELRGGNARLQAGAWLQTISDYTTWRVIKTSDVIPVVELLPLDIQKQIEALTPQDEKPTKPLTGKWVDATEHVVNTKDEIDAKWMKLFRAETGSTGEWFWLGQSLDRNKALIVRENEPGALGQLEKTNKLWNNEGADTREQQTLWDFFPRHPEKYVVLGSYFQMAHQKKPEPPLSLKSEHLKNIRAVRSDLLVKATLGKQVYWDNDTPGTATHKACMWEVVQTEESEKDEAPPALETHLFKAFQGVGTQRGEYCERAVYLIKKDAIEILDEDYNPPAHNHAFVGEPRTVEAGCLRIIWRSSYKTVKGWFR